MVGPASLEVDVFSFTTRQRRAILRVVMISTLLGGTLAPLFRDPDVTWLQAFSYGSLVGFLAPVLVISVREAVWHSRLVQLPFGPFAAANLALNGIAILLALQLALVSFRGFRPEVNMRGLLVGFAIAVGFTAWNTIDRFLGGGVLLGLLTGRYHHPRYEERVFLFADLVGSTPLAQELGDLRYHDFLNRVFSEIGRPVDRFGGTVHRYVGDEMIVTWTEQAGVEDAASLRCALGILGALDASASRFRDAFGAAPRLRIALHTGPVVAGELSGPKREIVFSGDTINSTARLAGVAGREDEELVLSSALIDRIVLPAGLEVRSMGPVSLKGRSEPMELFAVDRASDGLPIRVRAGPWRFGSLGRRAGRRRLRA